MQDAPPSDLAAAAPGTAPSPARRAAAWGVHLFTASGAVVGMLALLALAAGRLEAAALWMLTALAIDSVDGTLARAVGVRRVVPSIDGRRLDDMVDFLNYVIVPAVFLVTAGSVAGPAWAALPILASAYGFSQVEAKTEDDFFLGFPSYWNAIALYLWLFGIGPVWGTLWVTGFAVLVFVPLKYLYPSRMRAFRAVTLIGAACWMIALAVVVAWPGIGARLRLTELSLAYPAWYLGASFRFGGLARR